MNMESLNPGSVLNLKPILFYFFSAVVIFSAISVIVAKNPVRSVLSLIVTFFAMGSLWLLLEAEFLAIALVLVYVGAVMVLFLFVVMMLDIDYATMRSAFTKYLPIGLCISVLVIVGLIYSVGPQTFGLAHFPVPFSHPEGFSNVKTLGTLLYTQYLYPFEIAGILLLVAIIAAISLTFRGRRHNKAPEPAVQVQVTKESRLKIVKMQADKAYTQAEKDYTQSDKANTAVEDTP